LKRFVDGVEAELTEDTPIDLLNDRVIVHMSDGSYSAVAVKSGDAILVSYKGGQYRVEKKLQRSRKSHVGSGEMRAPMPGQIVDVRVVEGQSVKLGDVLVVLEAMKTQQPFAAAFDGVVSKVGVAAGDQVVDGQVLAVVRKSDEPENR